MTFILTVFSGLCCLVGIFSLGSWLLQISKWDHQSVHLRVVMGLGVFYTIFYVLSWVMPAQGVWYTIGFVFLLGIYKQFKQLSKFRFGYPDVFVVFLVVVFLPYIFRLFSPPVNVDGLSFYLPNIAWIHAKGLSFNPYLTNYTTMPLGIEYLFSIPFGLADYQGIAMMDALGTLALLHLLYEFSRKYMSRTTSQLFVVVALMIKGTFFFVFASGKIDTWNTYVLMTGLVLWVEASRNGRWYAPFLVFSIALCLKYTNYLLLLLPLIGCWLLVIKNQGIRTAILLALIPMFFGGSVLFRNFLLVKNPLAPLIKLEGQTRFVEIHQKIKWSSGSFNADTQWWNADNFSFLVQFGYQYAMYLLVPVFLALGWVFWRKRATIDRELKWGGVALISMYLPWFFVLGFSTQPLRFIWAPLLLTLWVILYGVYSGQKNRGTVSLMSERILLAGVSIVLISTVYTKHFRYIPDFFASQNRSLASWYSHVGRDHYALSYRFKELGLQYAKVNYRTPLALGAFAVTEYGAIPTQEEFHLLHANSEGVEYILDIGLDKVEEISSERIILQCGEYVVYRK